MAQPTRTYLLVEERLGEDLGKYVTSMRATGCSWMTICHDLADRTKVRLTAETIRGWFAGEKVGAA